MKAAFLILAHHQPEHLARLIKNLRSDWGDIYIHIDHKEEIEPFFTCVEKKDKPVFLESGERTEVTWCGYSTVEAVLSLLSAAFESGNHYDRFCLLSGSDFPVRPLDEIRSSFSTDTEFMRIDRFIGQGSVSSFSRTVRYYHFIDQQGQPYTPESGVIEREIYNDIDLYHGSTWWALSYECIGYIIDYLQDHPEYIEFHRHTFCPDEIFFHSIVKHSPFAGKLSHDFTNSSFVKGGGPLNEHGCHYIDWNAKNTRLPKVLNSGDLYHVLHSGMLFARKIDAERSSSLVSYIEKNILHRSKEPPEETKKEKTLVIFQAHSLSDHVLNEFYHIKSVVDQQASVKLFYDNTNSDFDYSQFQNEEDYFLFNLEDVFDYFKMKCISGNFYGNANLPLLYFFCHNSEYEYYWLFEYDVRFSGSLKAFIDSYKQTDADLLGTTLYTEEFNPEWDHWDSIESPGKVAGPVKKIRGFFPVVRYSKRACELLVMAYQDGWKGHYEGLVPTVLYFRDCKIEDIGGNGEFTLPERRGLFYSNRPEKSGLSPGTFVYRPDVSMQAIIPDMFYHPVKSPSVWERNFSSFCKGVHNIQLTERRSRGEQNYIFVISHMRSYSSLLCHILGSNPDICGYAETCLSYVDRRQIHRLHESVYRLTGERIMPPYVLDKILHNYWKIMDEMFRENTFRFIFLLRQPRESIPSIIRMIGNFSPDPPCPDQIGAAVNYYQERLKMMMVMAGKVRGNALFLPADDIVTKTDQTLSKLTAWLGLSQPLTRNYKIFSHTGKPGYGDPSVNILKGKVTEKKKADPCILIDSSTLDECENLYKKCYQTLMCLNERSAINL